MTNGGRALVLGGGGVTGIAWEIGMVAGLVEAGIDLTAADLVVGTSAGSVVGAQLLSGVPIDDIYQGQLADATGERAERIGAGVIARLLASSLWTRDPRRSRARARLGRAALAASTEPESEWRARFEGGLSNRDWPERRLLITAVDAESGEERVFERDSGVPLLEAVAASCAVPLVFPPVTIDGRRYIDGGVRSLANADLATGCDRVIVLAPVTIAMRRAGRIGWQLASLGPGVRSSSVSPDAEARRAIGRNVLDPARRAAAARAGLGQAARVARAVAAVWTREGRDPD
ncbi:MAG TPA: patatin-like phospholipase family protein [Candidatus Dormibacteraeota bacterium]|nr:patatin-like phospholipase family protein [Candidatus Dormibacteraeota bacterium]